MTPGYATDLYARLRAQVDYAVEVAAQLLRDNPRENFGLNERRAAFCRFREEAVV